MDQGIIKKLRKGSRIALLAAGLLAACVPAATPTQVVELPTASPGKEEIVENPEKAISPSPPTSTSPSASESPLPSPSPVPTPTEEPDFRDFSFIPLLPKDAIRPVYDPEFVEAPDSPLDANELVMGVAINGEAKAYPVSVLRFREMVDDELGGLPILVTW